MAPKPDLSLGCGENFSVVETKAPWNYVEEVCLPNIPITPPHEEVETYDYFSSNVSQLESVSRNLVAVIGIGYVGSQLIESFERVYDVLGFDISEQRAKSMQQHFSYSKRVKCTADANELSKASHFLIAVPTLFLPDEGIDTSYIREALATVSMYARPGTTVVIESSVAVGMTRQLLGPLAAQRGIFAGMSPERVDPGRTDPPLKSIPKIISGLDDIVPGSLKNISQLYSQAFDTIIPVSRPEVAEMTKLYENCQRMMCIAYANEMADACIPHGIDPFEICSAASTKPFGYTPFTPSLGIGGHCIPINPYYLLSNSTFPLLQAATERMSQRPSVIAQRTLDTLSVVSTRNSMSNGIHPRPRVLIVGVGFKRGQSVLSNSPGLALAMNLLQSGKVGVYYADSLVAQCQVPQIPRLRDEDWRKETLETFNLIIVAFYQVGMDFKVLKELHGVKVERWCC